MPCPSSERPTSDDNRQWKNYIQSVDITVNQYWEPTSLRDLVKILHDAEIEGKQVHAVGGGYSFEGIAATPDWMINLHNLNQIIESLVGQNQVSPALTDQWAARLSNGNDQLIHVQAGARLFDLCQTPLDSRGLTLPTMGGFLGQQVAGVFSTSTHGSDIDQPPLCDLVHAVHLVTVGGQEIWIESAAHPLTRDDAALRQALQAGEEKNQACPDLKIIRDDDLLNAVVVSMGRFGIIYSVVLEVTPAFRLAEYSQKFSWDTVAASLGERVGSDRPFEALNALLEDPPNHLGIAATPQDYRYLDVIFNSRNKNTCWVRRRWITKAEATDPITDPIFDPKTDLNATPACDPLCYTGAAHAVLQGTSIALDAFALLVSAIPGGGLVEGPKVVARSTHLKGMALNPHITGGEALAASLNAVWDSQVLGLEGELSPIINEITNSTVEDGIYPHESKTQGRRGQNWVISAGSKNPDTIGDCYRGNSIEIIFGLDTRTYIDFLTDVLEEAGRYRQAGYIALRFSRRSRALLSMHNVNHEMACSIEITSLRGFADNSKWMQWIEQTAIRRGGRPHWGQQNNLQAWQVEALYSRQRLHQWRSQLSRIVGNSTTFSNSYTQQAGLEPAQSSLMYAAWVHGHWLEVEFPDRMVRQTPFGFYYRLEGIAGSENWLHFAIPTPVIVDQQRLMAGSVLLRYRSIGGAFVQAVHVYDGEQLIAAHNGLTSQPTAWSLERYDVPDQPQIRWGLGLSVEVRFPNAGAKIEIAAAGCDFLGWKF